MFSLSKIDAKLLHLVQLRPLHFCTAVTPIHIRITTKAHEICEAARASMPTKPKLRSSWHITLAPFARPIILAYLFLNSLLKLCIHYLTHIL